MSKYTIHSSGRMRGDKVEYSDGIGCCIWYPFPKTDDDDDEGSGICFDFAFEDIDDMIKLLQEIRDAEPDVYVEE